MPNRIAYSVLPSAKIAFGSKTGMLALKRAETLPGRPRQFTGKSFQAA